MAVHTPIDQPEDFPGAFTRAWMARDGDALGALFAEDADFVNVVGIWWETRVDIAHAHGYALGSFFSETRLIPGRIKTRLLGSDTAVVQCRFRLIGQLAPDGSKAAARSTILTFVLDRRDAGWVAVTAQNTDIVPGAESHVQQAGLKAADYRP